MPVRKGLLVKLKKEAPSIVFGQLLRLPPRQQEKHRVVLLLVVLCARQDLRTARLVCKTGC